ncbi:MAG: LamG-like jellyroll fold domain-containing protein [Verrucomicrobiota bacterium]
MASSPDFSPHPIRDFPHRGLLAAYLTTIIASGSLHAQLLHRYDFATNANDSVGTAHGTLAGSATISGGSLNTTAVAGGLNAGVVQNGAALPSSAVSGINGAFTIETWFSANYGGGFASLFSFSDGTTANYVLATPARGNAPYASTISVIGGGSGGTEKQASAQFQDNGVLHHAVITYDGNTLSYFIDGALDSFQGLPATLTASGLNLSALPVIGINGGSPWPDNSINGSTLDFRIYGQALTPAQIVNLNTLGADAGNAAISSVLTSTPASSVLIDPPISQTNATGMGEWNTDGNLESWTTGGASGVAVSAGTLSGTGSAATVQVSKTGIVGGPDLDLGFNDLLDLRLQVPATFAGDIRIYHGTSFATGIHAGRMLVIPNTNIPKDGLPHLYRFDLGLEVPWRGNLTDLRVELTNASGVAFAVDYLRVGNLAGEIYQPRITVECPVAGGTTPPGATTGPNQTVYSMESKHFRFLWNDAVTTNGFWTANMAHGTLRNLEECWQVFVKKMGYREPAWAIGSGTSGTRYKLNVTSWHAGYWAGPDENYGRLNITPDGLRVDPPSGVIPHELMHCLQFHNSTPYVPGAWYEGHANYGQERYLQHFRTLFPANQRSCIDPTHLRCAHQILGHGRDYYLSWPMFLYLDENPDNLPDLGEGTLVKLWQQTQLNEYPLMTLERLTPTSSLKDIVGYFARRQATYNYKSKADIQAALANFGAPLDNAATSRWQFTDLVQRPDDASWWRVPYEMAPMQGAYALHELVPSGSGNGRVVTVNFHGLPDSVRGADWRASFIVISDSGTERYSTLWGSESNSVTLAANENKVYLSVAGAPATFHTAAPNAGFQGDFDDVSFPYRSTPSKARFPYEIQVTGATPKQRDSGPATGLTQHSNGGGWRAVSVPASVYIGPNARVFGGSVSGNARIEDHAWVSGGTVNGNAVISGHAWVRGGTVTTNAKVRDWALIEGGTVTGNARVLEHANIKGGTVQDIATAKGSAASNTGIISGNGMIDGDYGDFFSGRNVANGVAFGHVPYVGVPDSHIRALPTGLYASYDFATAHDSRILDSPGVTDGFTIGSPTWISADAKRKGFLNFDGSTQHVNLDRSVADLRDFTFTAWVKPLGGASNQSMLWLGATATKRLYFTPDDGAGHAKFGIVNGGAEQTLTSTAALTPGIWTHVAVTLNGTTATLYLNGVSVASAAVTIRPDQLLAANTATGLQHNYLAKSGGDVLPRFRGALDDVRFYGAVLSAADIAALQPASSVTTAGTLHVDLRATDASAGTATWINNGSLGHFTRIGTPTKTTVANIPAVQFSGSGQAYTGPNTIADLDGSSDRSIEVWAYNPTLADEETTVSWAYRGGAPDGSQMAFNFGSHPVWGAATHWGGGYDTSWGGAPPSAGGWHHLAYTYDGGTSVRIYLDGELTNTRALNGPLATWAAQAINIACQRSSAGGTRANYFSGSINSVRIHGGVLSPAQIAANHSLGPAGAPENASPTANAQSVEVMQNSSIAVILTGSDADADSLTFIIASQPTHGTLSGTLPNLTYTPQAGYHGPDAFSFTASDGAANSAPTAVNLTVQPQLTPTEIWRQAHFGANWNNPAVSGDAVDGDHDGMTNLLEYALGSDPNTANITGSPTVSAVEDKLQITFHRNPAASDIRLLVTASDDLTSVWTEIARSEQGAAFVASVVGAEVEEQVNGEIRIVQATDAVFTHDPAHPKRFMRLEVKR